VRSEAEGRGRPNPSTPQRASLRLPLSAVRTYRWTLGKTALAPAFALMLALLEAFGFQQERFFLRLGFWTAMMTGWVLAFAATTYVLHRLILARALPSPARRATAFAATAVIMMVIGQRAAQGAFGWEAPGEVVERLAQTLFVGGVFELTCTALLRISSRPAGLLTLSVRPARPAALRNAAPPAPPRAAPPAILRRLPYDVRGEILCLNMEDHYVRVHTTRGSTLLLMRFSDAIAELEATPGLRIHRSWWVAARAVAEVERSARSTKARLINGLRAPVSQPYIQALLQMIEMRQPLTPPAAASPPVARPPLGRPAEPRRVEQASALG
jgi:DNA-binding LytR/AlgR family response regulator